MPKTKTSGYSLGNAKQRFYYLKKYYSDPSVCKNCGRAIQVFPNDKPSEVRDRSYCTRRECKKESQRNQGRGKSEKYKKCKQCGKKFKVSRRKDGSLSKSKMCSDWCRFESRRKIGEVTVGELLKRSDSYTSARSIIQGDAKRVFEKSKKQSSCLECGYNKKIEVCHIHPVADFSREALIKEVNDPENLIPLCRNHHWEFDNGHLEV